MSYPYSYDFINKFEYRVGFDEIFTEFDYMEKTSLTFNYLLRLNNIINDYNYNPIDIAKAINKKLNEFKKDDNTFIIKKFNEKEYKLEETERPDEIDLTFSGSWL